MRVPAKYWNDRNFDAYVQVFAIQDIRAARYKCSFASYQDLPICPSQTDKILSQKQVDLSRQGCLVTKGGPGTRPAALDTGEVSYPPYGGHKEKMTPAGVEEERFSPLVNKNGRPLSYLELVAHISKEELAGRMAEALNLPYIKSLRSETEVINIGFDTEFYYSPEAPEDVKRLRQMQEYLKTAEAGSGSVGRCRFDFEKQYVRLDEMERYRIILSYQFAVQLDDEYVMAVWFLAKNAKEGKRLFYTSMVGLVMALYLEIMNRPKQCMRREAIPRDDRGWVLWKELPVAPIRIALVCSTGIADITAFRDLVTSSESREPCGRKSLLQKLSSIQGGLATRTRPIRFFCRHEVNNRHKVTFYEMDVRDTNCHASDGAKSVASLGKELGIEKVSIAPYSKDAMDVFFTQDPKAFSKYAVTDAIISVLWLNARYGMNRRTCVTVNAAASKVARQRLMQSMHTGSVREFDETFRGLTMKLQGRRQGVDLETGELGLFRDSQMYPANIYAKDILDMASEAYYGGLNACYRVGWYPSVTYDVDMRNAYSTAMNLCQLPDYTKMPTYLTNQELNGALIDSPLKLGWFYVTFQPPTDRKIYYSPFPIRWEGNTIYPLSSDGVDGTWVTSAEVYLGLKMGFSIHCIRGILCEPQRDANGTPLLPLVAINREMVEARSAAQNLLGTDNPIESVIKQCNNGLYGNLAQGVVPKKSFSGITLMRKVIGYGKLTNPPVASFCTALVRCFLVATMQSLAELGYPTYSVTTDGFINDLPAGEIEKVSCFGFEKLFQKSRMLVCNSPSVWVEKHVNENLLNFCTRGNVSLSESGVDAHNSFQTPYTKGSSKDRIYLALQVAQRSGTCECISARFANYSDIVCKGIDFNVKNLTRHISMDFDLKSRILLWSVRDVSFQIGDQTCVVANFQTEPYRNISEYVKIRQCWKDNRRTKNQYCIRLARDIKDLVVSTRMRERNQSARRIGRDTQKAKARMLVSSYFAGNVRIPQFDGCTYTQICEQLNACLALSKPLDLNDLKNWKRRSAGFDADPGLYMDLLDYLKEKEMEELEYDSLD